MSPRILITGSRNWTDRAVIRRALEQAIAELAYRHEVGAQITVVHGAARGADRIAEAIAADLGCRVEPDPVTRDDYARHGPTEAPKQRNQRMVDAGADLCLAFPLPGSRGTWDCVRRARAAAIPIRVHHPVGRVTNPGADATATEPGHFAEPSSSRTSPDNTPRKEQP